MICNTACKKWHIGNDIRRILLSDDEFKKLVGNNIFPLVAPEPKSGQKDLGTFVVYAREKYSRELSKMAVLEDKCLVSVSVISDDYDEAVNIAEAIDYALFGSHKTDCGEFDFNLYDSNETYQDDKYIETLIYEIK